jgi:hypothetical protein
MTDTFAKRFWRVGRSIAKWIAIVMAIPMMSLPPRR